MKLTFVVLTTTVAGVANEEVEKLWTTLISKYNPLFPLLILGSIDEQLLNYSTKAL